MLRAEDILGAWSLRSWTITFEDGRPPLEPMGAGARGRIHYAPDGYMSATIMRAGRTAPLTGDAAAGILKSYMHYTGRFRIEGDCVLHMVDFALDPALIGRDLIRRADLAGDSLTLTGEDVSPRTGERLVHVLHWTRPA